MPRAKQTDRAEARRRNRLASRPIEADPIDDEEGAEAEVPAQTGRMTGGRTGGGTGPGRPAAFNRPSFRGAFRAAYRRPDIRADLAALPTLLRQWPFLAGIGIILVGAALFSIFPGYSLSNLAFQFMTLPPAYAPIFVIGFFAGRATYLLGALVGFIDALVYGVIIVTVFPRIGGAPDTSSLPVYIGAALFWSVITGTFFAAGIAWYRRFLALTSPSRPPAKGGANKGKTAAAARRR